MTRRNLTLSPRHDKMLVTLSKKLDISMTETMQRAIECLEQKEFDKEVSRKLNSPMPEEEFREYIKKMKFDRGEK